MKAVTISFEDHGSALLRDYSERVRLFKQSRKKQNRIAFIVYRGETKTGTASRSNTEIGQVHGRPATPTEQWNHVLSAREFYEQVNKIRNSPFVTPHKNDVEFMDRVWKVAAESQNQREFNRGVLNIINELSVE